MRLLSFVVVPAAAAALLMACGGGDDSSTGSASGTAGGGTGGTPIVVDTLQVSGSVVDFETAMKVSGSATLSTAGLSPPPTISVTGADFVITGVPPYSVFHLLSGVPPTYRNTYNVATEVTDKDIADIKAEVVAETYLATLATSFNIMSAPNTGMIIARALDEAGQPRAGVAANVFTINGGSPPAAPRFLDANKAPDPALNQTSTSGFIIFYNVPAGLVTIGAADNSGVTIAGSAIPTAVNTVSLGNITVTPGGPVLPTNVSFSTQIVPIFTMRGCTACHSGNQPGADLGNLALNGSDNKIYSELTQEISPKHNTTRVNLMDPPKSLILTMPSFEPEPDSHPNATFASTSDPDYLKLLAWITEGAKQN